MKRNQRISLADDKRARVPFALVSVVLLTTSIVTAGVLLDRSTPEIDVSPDLVHERTTMAAESAVPNAVSDAIIEAGQNPVTDAHNNEVGAALAEYDPDSDNNFEDNPFVNPDPDEQRRWHIENADPDKIFERYVKLQIYFTVNNRLQDIEQTVSGQHGEARGQASLPELSDDQESIEDAIDRVELEIGYEENVTRYVGGEERTVPEGESRFENAESELDKGEYRATIDGVQHTVSVDGQQIHSQEQSYTVTGETAVFEMHSQVMEYQEKLDTTVEPMLYARIYPLFYGKALYENVMAPAPIQSNAFQQLIHNQELIVHTNGINYNVQQSTFGTTDQSYPTMMDAGYGCLAQMLGGQLVTGAIAGPATPEALKGIGLAGYPGESICYYIMYSEVEQASTTATTDIPPVSEFGAESSWQSQGDLYNHTPGSAERVADFSIDPTAVDDEFVDGDSDTVSETLDEQSLTSKEEIKIDEFANQAYIEMFDKDADHFGDPSPVDDSEIDSSVPEDSSVTENPNPYPSDEDTSSDNSSANASSAQEEDINRLRKQLIEDIEPVEVTQIQLLTADDVFSDLVYQIEQNSDEYVFGGTTNQYQYGLRNAYLRQVIDQIESVEEGRQDAAAWLDDEMGDDSLEELLIQGQAAIEGELDNPERIEEIADDPHVSRGQGLDRFDNASRTPYVWWVHEEKEERTNYRASRHSPSNEDDVGVPASVELDDDGIPETVSETMLFEFSDGGLPASTEQISSTSYTIAPLDPSDGGFSPTEIENETDEADVWNIRAIDVENHIYRATNGQLINRSLVGPACTFICPVPEPRTYFQLHEINEETMNLTDEAAEYVGEDVYTITALDVPQHSDSTGGGDPDEDLTAPDLRPADREDFEFDIRASPGYLSGLPITRDIEPTVRPPQKGPTNSRNSLFTPFSSKVMNPLPNPGVPIIPFPPKFWFASANYFKTDVKAEYARFELQSNRSTGLEAGTENYVRQDMQVDLDVGGESVPAGSVEPISIEATNHFPIIAPGFVPSIKAAPDPNLGSWGAGNNVDALTLSPQIPGVPAVAWTPEKCTAGWPDVGPGVEPIALDRGCADYGPIGQAFASPTLVDGLLSTSVMIHASQQKQERDAEQQERYEARQERYDDLGEAELDEGEEERIENLCTEADIEEGECGDVGAELRYD